MIGSVCAAQARWSFPAGRRWTGWWWGCLRAWCALLLAVAASAQEVEPDHPFRFGFSSSLLPEVNENDSRAAMKAWGEALVRDGSVRGDPNLVFCRDPESLANALEKRAVDGVALPTSEFFALRERIQFNRFVFGSTGGSIAEEYVLLVRADAGLNRIEDLRHRTLRVWRHSRMCLALPWLDIVLREKGLPLKQDLVGRTQEENKLNQAVLPVFFRKAEACLVTRRGFQTLGELNPQVRQQLRELAVSPPLVPTAFFFRAGYPEKQQAAFIEEVARLHTRPAGRQLLTVFQTDRMEEHPASVLDNALGLLERHRRLSATPPAPAVLTEIVGRSAATTNSEGGN